MDPQMDGFSVPIDNLTGVGVGSGFVHSACRLFRRARCEWTGRLHEQIAGRGDHRGIQQVALDGARIRHTGYLDEAMRSRNKTERNLRVAKAEVAQADGWEKGFSLTSLGRAYLTAGRFEEAFDHCREGLDHTDNPITRRLATRTAAEALTHLGRYDEALEWTRTLRDISTSSVQADIAEGKIRLARGEFQMALDLFNRVGVRQFDDDGFEVAGYMFAVQRAEALEGLGRTSDVADVLLEVLVDQEVIDVHLGILVNSLRRAGRPLDELAAAIPTGKAPNFLAQVLQLAPDTADEVLEACFRQMGDSRVVLATAATLARGLSIDRALTWSARIREVGFTTNCPLVAIATGTASPDTRARAAATVVRAFGDPRGREAFASAFREAGPFERETIRSEATALCPELLADVDTAGAGAGTRISVEIGGPRVSIVMPCFNQAEATLRCLQSLQATTESVHYEMILVDNASNDATVNLARAQNPRFRVVRNEVNAGFVSACNQGAALARGEYVLFLDNDTTFLTGWLEPLVSALEGDPALSAVYPELPASPGLQDDSSGVCLLVRGEAFREVGGFENRDASLACDNADLFFALQVSGKKVRAEPSSKVVHGSFATSGDDVANTISLARK
jgi:tetratricopeptide (TPR) repeat protein